MSTKFTTQHTGIRTGYNNLVARIVQTTHKALPTFNVLYLVEIIGVLFAKKFNKTLLKFLKILQFETRKALIIKIEIKVFLFKPVSNLLHQYRLSTTTYTRNNEYLGGCEPFVSYITLYITLILSLQHILLLKYYLLQ